MDGNITASCHLRNISILKDNFVLFLSDFDLKAQWFDHASINASQKDLRIFRSSRSQMFSKIGVLQKLCRIHKKAPVPVLHSCHLCNFVKKQTLTQIFSSEFCEIFLNNFFTEHLWTTASWILWKELKINECSLCNKIKTANVMIKMMMNYFTDWLGKKNNHVSLISGRDHLYLGVITIHFSQFRWSNACGNTETRFDMVKL